ncbi:MAG: AhpC/TSA family protein [Anaerolineaceae bacterium]
MCDYIPRIHAVGGELLILGNGTPEQAQWFVEDYRVVTPVFTDPALRSHTIVGAGKQRIFSPRTLVRAIGAMRKGFRQNGVKGAALQLGGVFVISADGGMPYQYLSRFAGDHPDPEGAVAALERLRSRSSAPCSGANP